MFRNSLIALLVLAAIATTGCTTTQKYMAGGATVGAIAGGVWADDHGLLSAAEGALVGGATGATIGALIGDQVDEKAENAERDALAKQLADAQAENDRLRKELEDCLNRKPETVTETKTEYLSLTMLSDVLFKPGKAVLREEGKAELNALAEKLNGEYVSQQIMIEGHTDNTPIRVSKWTDNWELGSARSLAVLRYLASRGVDEQRMAASTYAFYVPAATNDTVEGRAQNRRSEIAIHTGIQRKK